MSDQSPESKDPSLSAAWPEGFDGHMRDQQERLARLPFSEKLKWLEEAQKLARRIQRNNTPPTDEQSS